MPAAKKAPVKKAATSKAAPAKAAPKAEAPAWNTIHIFGYGESQLIGGGHNGKVANSNLKALEPLLASLAGKQQKGTKLSLANTHAINIFNNSFVDFMPKQTPANKAQRFAWSDLDAKQIDKLATELISKVPEQQPRKNLIPKKSKKLSLPAMPPMPLMDKNGRAEKRKNKLLKIATKK